MGRFKFQFCWRVVAAGLLAAGTSTTKGHAKPDFSFCPCYGALSDNLHWERAQRKAPGIPALTAPLGTTWRLGRLATAQPATKIGLHPSLLSHVASCRRATIILAYIASWGKNKPPPWLRLPPSTNPSSGRCG